MNAKRKKHCTFVTIQVIFHVFLFIFSLCFLCSSSDCNHTQLQKKNILQQTDKKRILLLIRPDRRFCDDNQPCTFLFMEGKHTHTFYRGFWSTEVVHWICVSPSIALLTVQENPWPIANVMKQNWGLETLTVVIQVSSAAIRMEQKEKIQRPLWE